MFPYGSVALDNLYRGSCKTPICVMLIYFLLLIKRVTQFLITPFPSNEGKKCLASFNFFPNTEKSTSLVLNLSPYYNPSACGLGQTGRHDKANRRVKFFFEGKKEKKNPACQTRCTTLNTPSEVEACFTLKGKYIKPRQITSLGIIIQK